MRPVGYTLTGVVNGAVVAVNLAVSPPNIGLAVIITGTITYSVQHTFDDIWDPAVTPIWFNHPTMTGLTANADGNYISPPRGVRLITTAGTGTARLVLNQPGGGV